MSRTHGPHGRNAIATRSTLDLPPSTYIAIDEILEIKEIRPSISMGSNDNLDSVSAMEAHRILNAPASMYYIPNFINAEEERAILDSIPENRWISLSHRRLQAVPARLTATNTLLASPLPKWLTEPIVSRFQEFGVFANAPHGVNHCLINEYLPGQGIMPHVDGAAYHPVVATVSLRGTLVLDVSEKPRDDTESESGHSANGDSVSRSWRIVQEPRSLLVTAGSAYTDTLHGVAEVKTDVELSSDTVANWDLLGDKKTIESSGGRNERTTRISLTYRDVKKVSNISSKLFGKPKS